MSAVVVLSAEFYEKSAKVYTVDGTKEKSLEALCLDSDSEFEEAEVKGLEDDDFDRVHLVSNDGQRYEVRKKYALMCGLVEAILEGDPTTTEIPLRKVEGRVLAFAVEYLEHHCGKQPAEIAKPLRSVQMKKIVEDLWDAEFVNKRTTKDIFAVILAANYVDCHSLLHLFCGKVATMIKGKSAEEIHQILSHEMADKIPALYKPKPKVDTEEATDKMDDSTLMGDGDESVSDKPEPSHFAPHTEEDTKEVATELQSAE